MQYEPPDVLASMPGLTFTFVHGICIDGAYTKTGLCKSMLVTAQVRQGIINGRDLAVLCLKENVSGCSRSLQLTPIHFSMTSERQVVDYTGTTKRKCTQTIVHKTEGHIFP